MWICTQCHTENHDYHTVCEKCGTKRAAGRFGSAPTAMRTQLSTPGAPITPARYTQQERRQLPPSRRIMQLPAKVIGWALLVLLPVLTALLFWRQYDALSAALVPLLLDAQAAQAWQIVCYIGFGLVALLLSTLPGLRTLLQCTKRPKRDK